MSTLAGTGDLVRLAIRRDRVRLAIWLVALVGLAAFAAGSIMSLYPDEADLAEQAVAVEGNAAVVALSGPARGLDTHGGRVAFELWQLIVAAGLLGLFTVVRHTRHEEEAGRTELVRSVVVGRHAHSAAALVVAGGASLALGLGIAVVLVALGLGVVGSLLSGAAYAAVSVSFAAVGLLVAQVTEHGRAATGLGVAALAGAFLARAAGDAGGNGLSWASPIGWAQATQPYAGDRWWPLALVAALVVAAVAAALVLEGRRDVGAGLVRPRPGPPEAAPGLRTPLALAWRIQRGTVTAWVVGAALASAAMGAIAESADELVGDNEDIQTYLANIDASLSEVFVATLLIYAGLAAAGFALQAVLRARSEEVAFRAEPILATATGRLRWCASHLTVALGGTVAVLVVSGAGMGLAYGLAIGDLGQVPRLATAAVAYLPPVLFVGGLAVALFGLAPRAVAATWALLALAVVVGLLGEGLDLPQWLRSLSPFDHVPAVPAAELAVLPLALLAALGASLAAAGLAGLRHRDIG